MIPLAKLIREVDRWADDLDYQNKIEATPCLEVLKAYALAGEELARAVEGMKVLPTTPPRGLVDAWWGAKRDKALAEYRKATAN